MPRFPAGKNPMVIVAVVVALAIGVVLVATGGEATTSAAGEAEQVVDRDPDVPDLPFDDNPDPNQCGIPVQWGDGGQAWLTGIYDGALIQSTVLLYDSHLRKSVVGSAPHGTEVQVVLFQENPVLDYYFVKIPGAQPQEGWIPAPLLSFDPVS